MPDPRHYIGSNHTFVRGYVRRKKKRRQIGLIQLLLILAGIGFGVWLLAKLWVLVTILGIIALGIFIWVKVRQLKARRRECEITESER
jgi:cobalamin biosynthesis protein CobD/CbiB